MKLAHAHYCATCDGYAPCYWAEPSLAPMDGQCLLPDSCPVCESVPDSTVTAVSSADSYSV